MSQAMSRFDLFSLIEWTAALAFLIALLAGSGGTATWTTDFKNLPEDDSALLSWLKDRDLADVTVTRESDSITMKRQTGVAAGIFHSSLSLPKPPWQKLGYSAPTGMRGSTSWSTLSGSIYLWLIGIGILILLGQIRKRYITPRH